MCSGSISSQTSCFTVPLNELESVKPLLINYIRFYFYCNTLRINPTCVEIVLKLIDRHLRILANIHFHLFFTQDNPGHWLEWTLEEREVVPLSSHTNIPLLLVDIRLPLPEFTWVRQAEYENMFYLTLYVVTAFTDSENRDVFSLIYQSTSACPKGPEWSVGNNKIQLE